MSLKEYFTMSLENLKTNKMRAFLTMLGIIIGVSAVITITTLGNIMTKTVTDIYDDFGINTIQLSLNYKKNNVRDYYDYDDFFTADTIGAMRTRYKDRMTDIGLQTSAGSATIHHNDKNLSLNIQGVNSSMINFGFSEVIAGRYINDNDVDRFKQVCVLSEKQAKKLYSNTNNALGKTITVDLDGNSYDFMVVGIIKSTSAMGSAVSGDSGSSDWDVNLFIPINTAQKISSPDMLGYYYYFNIAASETEEPEVFAQELADYFNNSIYRDNDSFKVSYYTAKEELNTFTSMLGVVSTIITVIAGISLLVGGIGVMNIMLVSVTERTREIGVRKALGAPNSAIRLQFIIEAMVICLIGGAIGLILGLILGNVAGLIVGTIAPPSIFGIIMAITFSMAIGLFFGYYPANKAAKLNPIDALRFE